MKDNDSTTKKTSPSDLLNKASKVLLRYAAVLFIILLIGVFGFVGYQIVAARSAEPGDGDITAKIQAAPTPHIDPNTVSQLQSLQDNSVNVKTLFDEARSNPFQE